MATLSVVLENPLITIPVFILEELGIPMPLVLSGLFIYVGHALALGDMRALLFIPANLIGTLLGATGLYWAARKGIELPLWRNRVQRKLAFLPGGKLSLDRHVGLMAVIGARMMPVPMILVSFAFGGLRLPYWTYALGVLIATLIWNVVFITGGVVAGLLSTRYLEEAPALLRYTPALLVWIGIAVALARWKRSRAQGRASSQEAPVP